MPESGLRSTIGDRVCSNAPWVRIPLSPYLNLRDSITKERVIDDEEATQGREREFYLY